MLGIPSQSFEACQLSFNALASEVLGWKFIWEMQ